MVGYTSFSSEDMMAYLCCPRQPEWRDQYFFLCWTLRWCSFLVCIIPTLDLDIPSL